MKNIKKLFLFFGLILSFNFISSSFAVTHNFAKQAEVSKLEILLSDDYVSTEEFIKLSIATLIKNLMTQKPAILNAIINDIKNELHIDDCKAYEELGAMLASFYTQLFESFEDNFRSLVIYSLKLLNNSFLLEANNFKISDLTDFQEYLSIMTFISFKFLIDKPSRTEKAFFKDFAFGSDFDWKQKELEVLNLLKLNVWLPLGEIEEFVDINF